MTFQPRFKGSIPSELSASLTLTGGKLLQPITLEREAEAPTPEVSNSSQDSASDTQEKPHEQDQSLEKSHEEVEGAASSSSVPQKGI